jgi:hypothetical protein
MFVDGAVQTRLVWNLGRPPIRRAMARSKVTHAAGPHISPLRSRTAASGPKRAITSWERYTSPCCLTLAWLVACFNSGMAKNACASLGVEAVDDDDVVGILGRRQNLMRAHAVLGLGRLDLSYTTFEAS